MYREFEKEVAVGLHTFLTKEELGELHKAQENIRRLQFEATRKFLETPEGKYHARLGVKLSMGQHHDQWTQDAKFNSSEMKFKTKVQVEIDAQPVPYIPEPVLNSLLHMKLLSDAQKLKLLYERGYIEKPEMTNGDPDGSI